MEKQSDTQTPYSWWLDSHNRSHHTQWLHSTLAVLERKTKMILDIIQDNGDTFAKRAEMYYQKRPQLIKMVQDLHKSYRVLTDHLRSESLRSSNTGSLSSSFRQVQHFEETQRRHSTGKLLEVAHSHSGPILENPEPSSETSAYELVDSLNTLLHNMKSEDSIKKLQKLKKRDKDSKGCNGSMFNHKNGAGVESINENLEMENRLNELKIEVSKLLEDNLSQQAELIKRNDDKRETIKELGLQINRLVEENKMLRYSLGTQKTRSSKFKFPFFG